MEADSQKRKRSEIELAAIAPLKRRRPEDLATNNSGSTDARARTLFANDHTSLLDSRNEEILSGLLNVMEINNLTKSLMYLPAELLHLVCNYADIPGLKALRLTNSTLDQIAISHLYCEVYQDLRKGGFNNLGPILERPEFARHIKSLDIDSYAVFCNKTIDVGHQKWHTSLSKLAYYQAGIEEAIVWVAKCPIISKCRSWLSLFKGMPKLKSLRYCANPSHTRHWAEIESDIWLLYNEHFIAKGLFTFLVACHSAGIRLENLEMVWAGWGLLNMWCDFFDDHRDRATARLASVIEPAMASLTTFKMYLRPEQYTEGFRSRMGFGEALRRMPNLKVLDFTIRTISLDGRLSRHDYLFVDEFLVDHRTSRVRSWHDLGILILGGVRMEVKTFFALLNAHVGTLRVLELENLVLPGKGIWIQTLPRLREWIQHSKVESITIRGKLLELEFPFLWNAETDRRFYKAAGDSAWSFNTGVSDYLMNGTNFPMVNGLRNGL